jgi:hypothetical protein
MRIFTNTSIHNDPFSYDFTLKSDLQRLLVAMFTRNVNQSHSTSIRDSAPMILHKTTIPSYLDFVNHELESRLFFDMPRKLRTYSGTVEGSAAYKEQVIQLSKIPAWSQKSHCPPLESPQQLCLQIPSCLPSFSFDSSCYSHVVIEPI